MPVNQSENQTNANFTIKYSGNCGLKNSQSAKSHNWDRKSSRRDARYFSQRSTIPTSSDLISLPAKKSTEAKNPITRR